MTSPRNLEIAFERIGATRMAGMPILNAALHVQAVGFRDFEGRCVGMLVTPWMLNLVVLPGEQDADFALAADQRRVWTFPEGAYEFMGGSEPECGPFHFCSLFSPVNEFEDQAAAVATSEAVMDLLFRPARAVSRRAVLTGAAPAPLAP